MSRLGTSVAGFCDRISTLCLSHLYSEEDHDDLRFTSSAISRKNSAHIVERRNSELEAEQYVYVLLGLGTERLSDACCTRLRGYGARCIYEADPFQAYAVVVDDPLILRALEHDPDISSVREQEPPSSF